MARANGGDIEAMLDQARTAADRRFEQLEGALAAIIDSSESANLDDEHDPEGATVGFERAQIAALLERSRDQLAELDAARERLRCGCYGLCESCNRPIGRPRLDAQPAARLCIGCARGSASDRRPRR